MSHSLPQTDVPGRKPIDAQAGPASRLRALVPQQTFAAGRSHIKGRCLFACLTALLVGTAAHGGTITWGSVADYSTAADVSSDGLLVEAINLCGAGAANNLVVNGVRFVADTTLLSGDATTDFFFGDTGDSQYNQLLNSLDYQGSSASLSVGAGLLEAGKIYQIQLWFVDERGSSDSRAMQFGDGTGSPLSGQVNDQYVTGTFTADGASQTITVSGVSSGPHFNAYQVRDVSSPIPALTTTAGETVTSGFVVSLGFSENISGLSLSDFSVTNGTASNLSGSGSNWSVTITPAGNGDVRVTLPKNSVTDGNGHGNAASNTVLTTYVDPGSEQPVPSLSTSASEVHGEYEVQVDFSEEVTGLEAGDFTVSGGTVSSVSGSGKHYAVLVSPNFGGEVALSLPRNSVQDTDGDNLQNVASNTLVVDYHVTAFVSSPAELLPYLVQDNATVTLTPGTYTITAADVTSTFGTPRFEFRGSNSTYDFTGVTINFAADIYTTGLGMDHLQVFGNDNVLKNLTMVDLCDKYGQAGKEGGVNIIMDGRNNRIEGFHMTIRGSYPYGYGDCFGKGGPYTIKHWKHSALLVRGESNHVKNCTLIHRSYGHAVFMQAASNPKIEGCYIEGEVRSTDDMLAESSGPAYDIDFLTVWGFRLPPGYMKSTGEGGIRAYNAGNTVIDGVPYSRGTSNPTIIGNTVVNMRTGVTLTHASGTRYVADCTTLGTERGYAIGSGIIENCFSDVKHGPAFGVDYSSDNGVTADITIVPHDGAHYNGDRHVAYIQGSNHKLTFRGTVQNPEQDLIINMGGDFNHISASQTVENNPANNIVVNNLTGYPLVLDANSSGNKGRSIGPITDAGTANSITPNTWDVLNNLAFLGKATQSSNSSNAIASIATDQNIDGNWANGSVTHTTNQAQPWWRIDLKGIYDISEIKIWGRTDSSQSRLSNYDITILDENQQTVWTNYQENYPNPFVSLLPAARGRHVLIQLRGTNPLSLAEVQIFGTVVGGPSNLAAVAGTSQIDLSWDAAANATGYTVKRSTTSGGPYANLGTTSATTFTDSTALSGTTYYYIVTATIDGEESPPSNESSASFGIGQFLLTSGGITASTYQDPNVPENTIDGDLGFRWSAQGDGQWIQYDLGVLRSVQFLKIAWHNGASRVSSFHVEVSNDGATWTSITATLPSSGTTAELETVDVPDTIARYVRIVGHGNSTSTWNSITEVEIWGSTPATPPVPADLAPAPGNGQVVLTWTASEGATIHHLKRATSSGGNYTTIASEAGGSFIDSGVSNGSTYYYVVSAENAFGESSDSAPMSAKPHAPISPDELVGPAMSHAGDGIELGVQSVNGRIYQLQRNETLAPETWEDVGDPVTGDGTPIILSDPDAFLVPKCFYRLQIEP